MKVFISADIEGIATTSTWEECDPSNPAYPRNAQEMTKEVVAAVNGAFDAGATEVVVRDAHGAATNIDQTQMPSRVILQRSYTGHPYMMVEGIDPSYDAAMFIGYHSAASKIGNPLSHTLTGRPAYIKINGRLASEFMIYSWACALEGVPTVFLSGDKMLCEDETELHPSLVCVPTKECRGSFTRNYALPDVHSALREKAAQALQQDFTAAKIELPKHFEVEIFFKEQWYAEKVSYYPGVKKLTNNIVTFESDEYLEILRTLKWIM